MIVDMTRGYEIYSLMDGFSEYNQIKIAPEDQEKMTFACAWGIFGCNVVPFHLKNIGATYQRAMTTIFHDKMHKIMEDISMEWICKSNHLSVFLKIDFAKAYDRIEWPFILAMLQALGFGPNFLQSVEIIF